MRQLTVWFAIGVAFLLVSSGVNAQGDSAEWIRSLEAIEPVEMSDGDMQRLLKTVRALDEQGIDEVVPEGASPDVLTAEIRKNPEMMRVLKTNGYSVDGFQSHIMNMVMAMGALELRDNKAEIEASLAQLEAMKAQLPPAQYEMMYEQVAGTLKIFEKAPAGNIALAEKYKADFEAIGED